MLLRTKISNLPLPYYAPDKEGAGGSDERSDIQKQRAAIKVISNQSQSDEADESDNNENELDKSSTGEEENQEKEEGEEGEEDEGKEAEEAKELTPEQKQIQALERKIERLQKRVGKTAGERDEIKKELKAAKTALEAKVADGEQPLTEEEVNRRAKQIADEELTVREFNRAQEKLIEDATKIDKNFMSKVNDLAAEVAPLPQFFIGALNDIENGGAVLNYLTDNHDEYEDLINKPNPMKIMKGLLDISNKLIEASKPKVKKISGAPNPPKAPKGNSSSPDVLPPKPTENMADFVRLRNKQVEERRKQRMG